MKGIRAEVPIGKHVGSLVVLGIANNKNGSRHCRVRCSCGREFDAPLYKVRHDKIQTCRFCAAKAKANRQPKTPIPIGEKVGSLVVVGNADNKNGKRHCRVRCSCGREFDAPLYAVKHNRIQTCRFCAAKINACHQQHVEKYTIPIGMRFGRLTVVGNSVRLVARGRRSAEYYVPMQCDCGAIVLERKSRLNVENNDLKCVLCRNREMSNIYSSFKTAIVCKRTRLYSIWLNMHERCYNHKNDSYKYYGAKGVTICDEWKKDFNIFAIWAVTHGYDDNLTIDRINPFGNYTPDNCRWTTWQVQANNKRTNFHQPVQA